MTEQVKNVKFKDYLETLNNLAKHHPNTLEYEVVVNVNGVVEKYEPVTSLYGVCGKKDDFGNIKYANDRGKALSIFECNAVIVN